MPVLPQRSARMRLTDGISFKFMHAGKRTLSITVCTMPPSSIVPVYMFVRHAHIIQAFSFDLLMKRVVGFEASSIASRSQHGILLD